MYEKIRDRYLQYYIRDDQLSRYIDLGILTSEQTKSMQDERNGKNQEVAPVKNQTEGNGGAEQPNQ